MDNTRPVLLSLPTAPRQLALTWREDRSPFEDLPPAEQTRVVTRLAQLLLEALGKMRKEAADDLA